MIDDDFYTLFTNAYGKLLGPMDKRAFEDSDRFEGLCQILNYLELERNTYLDMRRYD